MKKALKYIIILAVSTVLTLLYGFCIGGEFNLWIRFTVFAVTTILLMVFDRKSTNKKFGERLFIILLTALCVIGFLNIFYNVVNESLATLQDTYEAEVVHVEYISISNSKDYTTLYFNSPDGEERHINIDGYRRDVLYEKITVEEYIGLFDKTFCVLKE